MTLPAPELDTRRFQELVNEAKRQIHEKCPAWTDHNVHDPGVTLIELFAWMTDQIIYRLNRVPDRNYVKFLELIGVHLYPPTAARAPVTFWLAAPQPETVTIPRGTELATVRTETEEAISFTTVEDLSLVASTFHSVVSAGHGEQPRRRNDELREQGRFDSFSQVPQVGDVVMVGLTEAVPSCAVTLRFGCEVRGVGVDPNNPPLVWEAFSGGEWVACEVERDETGGLNREGDVVLHVPRSHAPSVFDLDLAGWLRARVTDGHPAYTTSPRITSIAAFTCGGTVDAVNAERVDGEVLGTSDGAPAQRFLLGRRPVVAAPLVLEVSDDQGWKPWRQVDDFSDSGPEDPHFVLDAMAGEVQFGPAVREPHGGLLRYGRTPPPDSQLRVGSYLTGGGSAGNVARHTLSVLRSSIPYVREVGNRRPAAGGVDGEDIASAKVRAPLLLRTLGRAVTAEDYEHLAREAAPEVSRVRCTAADGGGPDAGGVRVLVVPAAVPRHGELAFEQLQPSQETLRKIENRLDECRVVGSRVVVGPPYYRGLTVVARLRARRRGTLEADAREALYTYFNPIVGGPDGQGWPFGRRVHLGEVYSVLQKLPDLELIEDVRLFGADPVERQRGAALQRLDLGPHELVFSYDHQVRVDAG
jgi:predicted phage baseplate assembly protein